MELCHYSPRPTPQPKKVCIYILKTQSCHTSSNRVPITSRSSLADPSSRSHANHHHIHGPSFPISRSFFRRTLKTRVPTFHFCYPNRLALVTAAEGIQTAASHTPVLVVAEGEGLRTSFGTLLRVRNLTEGHSRR